MTDLERSPFDPELNEMRRMGTEVVDLVTRFIDDRYTAPAEGGGLDNAASSGSRSE